MPETLLGFEDIVKEKASVFSSFVERITSQQENKYLIRDVLSQRRGEPTLAKAIREDLSEETELSRKSQG